jgi:hypothetical protein
MKNQFFYTRTETLPSELNVQPVIKKHRDSFNIDKVIRTLEMDDDRLLVLLDDIHERTQEVPIISKANKVTGYKKERNTFQSEIYLEVDDVARFYKMTALLSE